MDRALKVLFFLYFTACLSSMAGMEILSWSIALLSIVAFVLSSKKERISFSIGPDRALMGLLVVTFVGALFNTYEFDAFLEIVGRQRWILLLYLLTLSTYFFRTEMDLSKFYKLILCLTLVVSVYSIYQYFSGIDIIRGGSKVLHVAGRDPLTSEVNRWRATGFFGSPMTFGYSFGLTFSLIFGMIVSRSTGFQKNKFASFFVLTLSVFALVVSFQRGVWLSTFVAALSGLALTYSSSRQFNWKVILPFFGLFITPFLFSNFRSRFLAAFDTSSRSVADRVNLWRANFEMFLDSPVWGVGYGENEILANVYLSQIGIIDGFAGHAHNTFIHYLSGTGIVGFISFLAFVLYFLWLSVSVFRRAYGVNQNIAGLALGAFCSQVFLHTGGLTECNFKDAEVNHQFILILVLLVYFSRRLDKSLRPM